MIWGSLGQEYFFNSYRLPIRIYKIQVIDQPFTITGELLTNSVLENIFNCYSLNLSFTLSTEEAGRVNNSDSLSDALNYEQSKQQHMLFRSHF